MNKNIIIVGIIVIGGFAFLYNSSSDTKQNEKEEKVIIEKKDEPIKKKSIEILYLEDDKEQTKIIKNIVKVKKEEEEKKTTEYTDVYEYAERNNLVNITKHKNKEDIVPRFSIYADISEEEAKAQYDKNLPPPAPAIVTGSTNTGSVYTVVIPPYSNIMNRKIIVIDSQDGSYASLDSNQNEDDKDTDTKNQESEIIFIAPPTIGQ